MAKLVVFTLAVALAIGNANALYSSSSPVELLDSSNLNTKLSAAGGMALVEFYAEWCGHCKALQPEYEKAAKAAKGGLMVAAVDADKNQDLAAQFGIKGFPTIKFLYLDANKVKSVDYNGQRTAKDMITFAFEKAKNLVLKRLGAKSDSNTGSTSGSKAGQNSDGGFYSGTDVVTLTDDNFKELVTNSQDLWLVEFYAPWCGHCKALKPAWIQAASQLKGKVNLGAIDCTAHQTTCSQFGVQGYPTIKFINGKAKGKQEDYTGGREADAIVAWATNKWSKYAPAPEVKELINNSVWEDMCMGKPGAKDPAAQLCFLAFLPDILDSKAAGRNAYIESLKKLADKFKDRPYNYLWVQGGSQADLEANLGVGGFGYPAFVAFKPRDLKYSLATGAFEYSHMVDFVDGLRLGTERVLSVQGDMAAVKTIEPWDGKDAQVALEDEFSLDELFKDEL